MAFHSESNPSRDVPLRNVIAVASSSKVVTDVESIVSIWYFNFSDIVMLWGFAHTVSVPSSTYVRILCYHIITFWYAYISCCNQVSIYI